MPDTPTTAARDSILRGILHMVGATAMFAVGIALTKWLLDRYPVGEVAFLRQLFSTMLCAAIIMPAAGLGVFRTRLIGQHVTRSVAQFTSQMLIILALTMMPLGTAMSISFSAPLFATLFAVLFLGERVGIHRSGALLAGFIGVLLVTEPGGGGSTLGAALALGNAMMYAAVTVGVRRMTGTESAETLTMHQMLWLTLLTALLLPLGFVMPTPFDGLLLVLSGVFNGIGQLWWTRALRMAPTSAVTPFYYLSLVWALLIGYAVWGDVPTAMLMSGAAIVVASGLYILWRESVVRRRPR